MKHLFLGITLALAATAAFATQTNGGDTCNGNGSCGQTTNNTYNTTNAPTANASATGGNATVIDNSKTTNTNVNANKNEQGQAQGQKQGQAQGQLQGQKQGQSQSAIGSGNSTALAFNNNERLQPGSVAVAATTTTASCRVAVSGGVSFPGGAVGFGSAYKDEKCDKRALGLALIDAARVAASIGAPGEFVAPLFNEGLALLRASGEETAVEEKSVRPTTTAPAMSVSASMAQ